MMYVVHISMIWLILILRDPLKKGKGKTDLATETWRQPSLS